MVQDRSDADCSFTPDRRHFDHAAVVTLAAHLAGAVTTLCRCWRLTRRDGVTSGFTDHDRDLAFAETTFLARTGLEAAEAGSIDPRTLTPLDPEPILADVSRTGRALLVQPAQQPGLQVEGEAGGAAEGDGVSEYPVPGELSSANAALA